MPLEIYLCWALVIGPRWIGSNWKRRRAVKRERRQCIKTDLEFDQFCRFSLLGHKYLSFWYLLIT